jgi:hypothetical protein
VVVCHFNGYSPPTSDLHKWIHSNYSNNCEVCLYSKGIFVVQFVYNEDYCKNFKEGPCFWG